MTNIKNIEWKVESTPDKKKLKTICDEIDSALKGEGGIKLDPEYQREYKFTQEDESSLIESMLMNIPIPVIYLSSDTRIVPYTSNVIDGQHRLRAIYRFIKNEFTLKGLEIYSELNDKLFSDLPPQLQNKLLHQSHLTFENIHVQDNPKLEIEIFKRYNKGTHPLSKPELRHSIYISPYILWLNKKIEAFFKDVDLRDFYNITKKRYADKSAHESICVMLQILFNGLDMSLGTSPEYADTFMEWGSTFDDQEDLINQTEQKLDLINSFLILIKERYKINHPFSKEIYGIDSRNYKLQVPILMILNGFLKYLIDNRVDILSDLEVEKIMNSIVDTLKNCYLEKDFKGSNTRPSALKSTLNDLIACYENNGIE